MSKKVIIVGGGFGGLAAARALAGADVVITLIDRTNHFLFQPLLYQVTTGQLSPDDIAAPIREILSHQKNLTVIMGEVVAFELEKRRVLLENSSYEYDYLIVATGGKNCYFGNEQWQSIAPSLKKLRDALSIRERVLYAFEEAERIPQHEQPSGLLNFVVVGGGPIGVEIAGALAELSRKGLRHNFRRSNPRSARIILVEALERILPTFSSDSSRKAEMALTDLGVEVMKQAKITNITSEGVQIGGAFIPARTVIWAAGIMGLEVIRTLGAQTNALGRVCVKNDCSIEGHPEVFVIGDAAIMTQDSKPLPALAPVAQQQGRYVAVMIKRKLGPDARPAFRYREKGIMAVISQSRAVMEAGKLHFSGYPAWLAWMLLHIMVMVQFRNRLKVMSEWGRYYVSGRPGARLITGKYPLDHSD